jgi:hypothetical protein
MSGLRVLLPLCLTVALFAQTEQNAVPNPAAAIDGAVRGIVKSSLGLARPMPPLRRPLRLNQLAPASKCSVAGDDDTRR